MSRSGRRIGGPVDDMDLKRKCLAILAVLGALSITDTRAHAQTFSELAAGAREVSPDLAALAAPLFVSCDALVGRSRELCETNLGRAATELEGATLLVALPAVGHVVVGPYEPRGGGFRVTVPGFEVVRPTGGVVGTRARRGGVMAPHALAETFVRVPSEEASGWVSRNAIDRLRLRLLVRFGEPYTDPTAPRAGERRAVVAEVVAAQVYNESAGDVILDSTAPSVELPDAPELLEGRAGLWTARRTRDVLWRTPDGDALLFHARTVRVARVRGVVPIISFTRGAETVELTRFNAIAPEASVDLVPHGRDGVLVVVTERRSTRREPGRGQVLYLRWDPALARVEVVARWRGSNDGSPPAWVRDPNAPLTEAAAEPPGGPT